MKKSKLYHRRRRQGTLNRRTFGVFTALMNWIFTIPKRKLFLIVAVLFGIELIAGIGWLKYREQRLAYLSGNNIVYDVSEVLGVQTERANVSVNFSKQVAAGTPLIFGGAHSPNVEHQDAWNKVADVGVTSVRSDIFYDMYIPAGTTIEKYQKNENNIQDTATWNQSVINQKNEIYKNAKKRGLKVFGIMSYAPSWLTGLPRSNGVPKDWNIYKDLVKKSYLLHREYLDYIEIWNEPDKNFFLDPSASGMSRDQAYQIIVLNAINAIKEADAQYPTPKKVKICIPSISDPARPEILNTLLADDSIRKRIDCISYHSYGIPEEPSYMFIKKILDKYGLSTIPLFVTEWSRNYKMNEYDPYIIEAKGIPYIGYRFNAHFRYGITGASYFQLKPIVPNSTRGDVGYLGFYKWKQNSAELLPVSKVFILYSKTLGLGAGPSKVVDTKFTNIKSAQGFINSKSQKIVTLVNESAVTKTVILDISGANMKSDEVVFAYGASDTYDGKKLIGTSALKYPLSSVQIIVPPNAVVGVQVQ